MNTDQLKNSVIMVSQKNLAIFIPSPAYSLGLYSHAGPEISLKKWFTKSLHGDPHSIKLLFEDAQITSEWWEYIVEHRNQFLSKNFVKQNVYQLKKFYNTLAFSHKNEKVSLENDPDVARFFVEYDFCNQVLAAGKYLPNPFDPDVLHLLTDSQLLDLMHNHITILDDKLELSNLQNSAQQDVLNHVCTHVTLEFWKWQTWI